MLILLSILCIQISLIAMESEKQSEFSEIPLKILEPTHCPYKVINQFNRPSIKVESTNNPDDFLVIKSNRKKVDVFKKGKKINTIKGQSGCRFKAGAICENSILLSAEKHHKFESLFRGCSLRTFMPLTTEYQIECNNKTTPKNIKGKLPSWDKGYLLQDGTSLLISQDSEYPNEFKKEGSAVFIVNEKDNKYPYKIEIYRNKPFQNVKKISFNAREISSHKKMLYIKGAFRNRSKPKSLFLNLARIQNYEKLKEKTYDFFISNKTSKIDKIHIKGKVVGIYEKLIISKIEKDNTTSITFYDTQEKFAVESKFDGTFSSIYTDNDKLILRKVGLTHVFSIPNNAMIFSICGGFGDHLLDFDAENKCTILPRPSERHCGNRLMYQIDCNEIKEPTRFLLSDCFEKINCEPMKWLLSNENIHAQT